MPLLFKITSDLSSFSVERHYPLNTKISDLKAKLELITGASNKTMKLQLFANEEPIGFLDQDDKTLDLYLSGEDRNVRLHVSDPSLKQGEFEDLSQVEKFELDEEEYAKRSETLRAFKMQNKLGRFAEEAALKQSEKEDREKIETEKAANIKVGDRCQVRVKGQPSRRGMVMFVGETHFKPGHWVGVKYDEPMGKNDGSFEGKRYFECPNKYGSFVRPTDVEVGDFPEEGMDFDEI